VIGTGRADAVGFNIPVAEFLTTASLARHRELGRLGPDLLAADFDPGAVLERMRAEPLVAIADALLNQRVMSGIGNVLRSEILFLCGVHPFVHVRDLDEGTLRRIIDVSADLLRINVADVSRTLTPVRGRRTTRRMNPAERLWVYGRAGLACRRCGTRIETRATGVDARRTYWCPSCQPAPR
jgi:endonuclease-8